MILDKVIVGQIKSYLRTCPQRLESDWGKFKHWWKKYPLSRSLAAGAYGLGLFLLIVNLLICWGIPKEVINVNTVNADAEKETFEFIKFIIYTIGTILTPIIVVASLRICWCRIKFQWRKKLNPWREKNSLINSLIIGICALGLFLLIIMFLTCEGGIFAWLLGTGTKKETIEFIAFGIGGLLAVTGAIAINYRAEAQIKSANAQVKNNKLIEKGHIDERFKSAIQNLGHNEASVRIASFYQFYYLAKGQDNEFKKNIFGILCAHLRNMTQEKSYREETGKDKPTEECQTLLNILLKPDDKSVFENFKVDMQNSYLVNVSFSETNVSNVNFFNANLSGASFFNTNFPGANFAKTNLSGAHFLSSNLSKANLSYTNLSNTRLFSVNLSDAILSDVNLSNANLLGTTLRRALFLVVDLMKVRFIGLADFREAKIDGRPIAKDNLPTDKGEYYADWDQPPWVTSPKREEN